MLQDLLVNGLFISVLAYMFYLYKKEEPARLAAQAQEDLEWASIARTEIFHKAIKDNDFETMERMMREDGTWTEEEELVFPTITS